MTPPSPGGQKDFVAEADRQAQFRNALLTIFIFSALLWTFWKGVNFYPVSAWTLFNEPEPLGSGEYTYYVLQGETVDGRVIDLPPIGITNAFYNRNQALVRAVEENSSFTIDSPHPRNVQLWNRARTLPNAARMNDLLEAWGNAYNVRFGAKRGSLRAVRLEEYVWPRVNFTDYAQHKASWRVELTTR